MRNILITGGAGFIGSNFVRYWSENHSADKITVLDKLTYAGNYNNISELVEKDITFRKVDIVAYDKVYELLVEFEINTIVHFAAESHVDRSIEGPDAFIDSNIVGTHNLLKAAKKYWNETAKDGHFHHVSTDEVYGSLKIDDEPFSETSSYSPNSPYSASKASSDFLVRAYAETYGLNVTISNCSNNYGPYQFPEKLIPLTILNILGGKNIPIYGDGANIRDWLYVEDHSRAIDCILEKANHGETYNIGGNNEWKNIDIVKKICEIVDSKFQNDKQLCDKYPQCPATRLLKSETLVEFVKDRPGHDYRYAINSKKIEKDLDFYCEFDFASSIEETINWYLINNDWWQSVLDGSYQKINANL